MLDICRNIGGVALRIAVAAELGISLTQCLEDTGIRAEDLLDPGATVTYAQEFQVIRNLLRHHRDPARDGDCAGLGIEVGRRYRFTSLGPIGFALVSSPNLRSALDIMLRYADLSALLVPIARDGDGPDLRMRLLDDGLPDDVRRFALEETTAGSLMVAQDLLGRPLTLRGAEYGFAKPAAWKVYEQFTGTTPLFDCADSALTFAAADVDAPLVRANPLALSIAEEQCRQLIAMARTRSGFSAQVRDYIALRPSEIPSMDDVASALLMTSRTLRRKLDAEGTTFLSLCDEVREVVAEQLLAVPQLPISEIAERLGYSEPASFIHAFKRWKGLTPHAYRQSIGTADERPRSRSN